jgi:hypothetical protein
VTATSGERAAAILKCFSTATAHLPPLGSTANRECRNQAKGAARWLARAGRSPGESDSGLVHAAYRYCGSQAHEEVAAVRTVARAEYVLAVVSRNASLVAANTALAMAVLVATAIAAPTLDAPKTASIGDPLTVGPLLA